MHDHNHHEHANKRVDLRFALVNCTLSPCISFRVSNQIVDLEAIQVAATVNVRYVGLIKLGCEVHRLSYSNSPMF
jgi:hypothetical protein